MKNIFIPLLLLLTACNIDQPTNVQPAAETFVENKIELTDQQMANVKLQTATAQLGSVPITLALNGKIISASNATQSICFPFGGYVKNLNLQCGMWVNAGEVIASLENAELVQLQQDFLAAKSAGVYLDKELARQNNLFKENASSQKVLEQTQLEAEKNRITLKALSEKLKLAGIQTQNLSEGSITNTFAVKTPIAGRVASVSTNNGRYLQPTDIIAEIVKDDVLIELMASSTEASGVQPGLTINIQLQGKAGNLKGKVQYINPVANDQNVVKIICAFDQAVNGVFPGMYLIANLELNTTTGIVLPARALVNFESKKFIFIQTKNNVFEMVEVEPYFTTDSLAVINSNMDLVSKQFVLENAYTLLMMKANKEE